MKRDDEEAAISLFMIHLAILSVTQDYIASNGRMIGEQRTRKRCRGKGRDLI
jgi:hypothetical protein